MLKSIKSELQFLLKINPAKRHWSIPFMASICVGVPMLFGVLTNCFNASLTVSLGGLVILYVPSNQNTIGQLSKLILCSFGFIVAYLIGLSFSFNPILSCIVFGVFSSIVYFFSKMFQLNPPGNFFFLLMTVIASGIPFSATKIPEKIGLFTLGTIFTCTIAFIFSFLIHKPNLKKDTKAVLSQKFQIKNVDYIESFVIGFFMFMSFLVAHLLKLDNPYWVPTSCLAVMQGVSTTHIWRRSFYRSLGTFLGMILCWALLKIVSSPIQIVLTIMLLQFIIETLIVKNYFIAVLFITPMTIFLAEAGSNLTQDPNLLIVARIKDVFLGSFFGIIGGWILYHEKLRYEIDKRIRITKRSLK